MSDCIPVSVADQMVRIANRHGRRGMRVRLQWLPPQTGADDPNGSIFIEPIDPPETASEPDND